MTAKMRETLLPTAIEVAPRKLRAARGPQEDQSRIIDRPVEPRPRQPVHLCGCQRTHLPRHGTAHVHIDGLDPCTRHKSKLVNTGLFGGVCIPRYGNCVGRHGWLSLTTCPFTGHTMSRLRRHRVAVTITSELVEF
jgi:hypothetical protein